MPLFLTYKCILYSSQNDLVYFEYSLVILRKNLLLHGVISTFFFLFERSHYPKGFLTCPVENPTHNNLDNIWYC